MLEYHIDFVDIEVIDFCAHIIKKYIKIFL